MTEFVVGSEDDWKAELSERPDLAALDGPSLLEEGALARALGKLAEEGGRNGAGGADRPSKADSPCLEELLKGAVDLSAASAPRADAADAGAQRAGEVGTEPAAARPAGASGLSDRRGADGASDRAAGAKAASAPCAFVRGRTSRSALLAPASSEVRRAGAAGGRDAGKPRVFDLHCDTLDRLALHGSAEETLWSAHDAALPAELMSSLDHSACHIALDRTADFAWCQCFAVFIPDEYRGDAAWALFQRVRRYFDGQMEAHADLAEQARSASDVDRILAGGKTAAVLTVEGAAFLDDPLFEGARTERADAAVDLDALAETIAAARASEADAELSRRLKEAELSGVALSDEAIESLERTREEAARRRAERADAASAFKARRRERDPFVRLEEAAKAGVAMMTLTWNGANAVGSGHDTAGGLTRFGREVIAAMEGLRMVVDVSHLNDRGFSDLLDVASRPFVASHSNARSVCGHRRNLTDAQARAIFEGGGLVGLNFCRDFLREDGADPSPDDVLRHVDRLLELGGERGLALGSDYDGTDVPSWLDGCQRVGALRELIARTFGDELAERVFFQNAHDFFARNGA